MDARKPAPTDEPPRKLWQPQSRIAGYIRGSVKLEEMVSREKLVRPEQRHNRRRLQALIDDDEPAASARAKNRSAISRCPSSSTKTSSVSRAGSAPQRLTADDLTRTIVEKNEHITALRDQLEALRSCARLEQPPEGGAELRAVIERMLECLLDVLTKLRHHDEHDERMAQFVAAVERERENVLRSIDALCRANACKDDELRTMSGECAQMRLHLQQLLQSGPSSEPNLQERLRDYQHRYQKAAEELRLLSQLTESVRQHMVAEKEAFGKCADDHRRNIDGLRTSCRVLGEKKEEAEKRLAQLARKHQDEVAQLRLQHEDGQKCVRQLEDDIRLMKCAEQKLRAENAALVAQLDGERQANEQLRDQVARLREEKTALQELADKAPAPGQNEKVGSFAQQESHWRELKQCLYHTAKRVGILPDDDVR